MLIPTVEQSASRAQALNARNHLREHEAVQAYTDLLRPLNERYSGEYERYAADHERLEATEYRR